MTRWQKQDSPKRVRCFGADPEDLRHDVETLATCLAQVLEMSKKNEENVAGLLKGIEFMVSVCLTDVLGVEPDPQTGYLPLRAMSAVSREVERRFKEAGL